MIDNGTDSRAAKRENVDPEERIRPMPLLPVAIAVGLIVWSLVYLAISGPMTPIPYGDQRTLADLRGPAATTASSAAGAEVAVDGKAIYAANCAACHQATGTGLPGVFPPLVDSDWVTGDPAVLVNILLHGIEGEIEVGGMVYTGMMPPVAQLSDAELAGVASYIRSEWGHDATSVDAGLVQLEREANRRDGPFAGGADLEKLRAELAN